MTRPPFPPDRFQDRFRPGTESTQDVGEIVQENLSAGLTKRRTVKQQPMNQKGRNRSVAYMLQLLYPGDFPEFAVKRPQRKMPGLASEFENQAVRETERRPRTENLQSRCYCFRILERKFSVMQEHFDCTGNLGRAKPINRRQHPHCFSERER